MGCIVASVERIGEGISLSKSRVGDGVSLDVERIGSNPTLTVSMVCSLAGVSYLNVSPEVVWLVPDNGFSADFVVVSNKDWIVE